MSRRRSKRLQETAIVLTRYREVESFVEAFATGHINLLILVGSHGLSKSRTVRHALGDDACWIEGNASPFQIYAELYSHRDRFVVIDDVDSLHAEKSGVRLLKSLCQTEPEKRVTWHTAAKALKQEGIPREFTTTSRVVIISNDWRSLNHNVAAVEDRGHVVHFRPTAAEVHAKTAEWFCDREVYDWVGERLHLVEKPSMRVYYRAQELKRAGLNWKRVLPEAPTDRRRKLAVELLRDSTFSTQEARARAFSAQGGGCRATFFNHVRRIRGLSLEA